MKFQDVFPLPKEWLQDIDQSLSDTVVRWCEQEVMSRRLEHHDDFDALLEPAIKTLFVDIGLQSLLWPESSGGCECSSPDTAVTLAAILEQVGRADTGISFLLANTFALQSAFGLEPYRSDALLKKTEDIFCDGKEPAVAGLVFPGYGRADQGETGDYHGVPYQVNVSQNDGGFVLNGNAVRPTCAGDLVKLYGVMGVKDGSPALFLVHKEMDGLGFSEPIKKTGLGAAANAEMDLENINAGPDDLIFEGLEPYQRMQSVYYLGCSASCVGAGFAAWEILKEWGEVRVIKGKGQIFKNNPLVAALMGNIGQKIGLDRILVFNLARLIARPEQWGASQGTCLCATATAITRAICSDTLWAINAAMELMASAGYATEWNLERYWRDVKTVESYLGPEPLGQMEMAGHYFGSKTD